MLHAGGLPSWEWPHPKWCPQASGRPAAHGRVANACMLLPCCCMKLAVVAALDHHPTSRAPVPGASVPGQSARGAVHVCDCPAAGGAGGTCAPAEFLACRRSLCTCVEVYICVRGLSRIVSTELASSPMLRACPAAPAKSGSPALISCTLRKSQHESQVPPFYAPTADSSSPLHPPSLSRSSQRLGRALFAKEREMTSARRIALCVVAVLAFAAGSNAFRRVGEAGWRACACWRLGTHAMRSALAKSGTPWQPLAPD